MKGTCDAVDVELSLIWASESDCTVVLQQKCDNATLIIFISTTSILLLLLLLLLLICECVKHWLCTYSERPVIWRWHQRARVVRTELRTVDIAHVTLKYRLHLWTLSDTHPHTGAPSTTQLKLLTVTVWPRRWWPLSSALPRTLCFHLCLSAFCLSVSVRLSVCKQDCSKTNLYQIYGTVGHNPLTNQLGFAGNLDLDSESFEGILSFRYWQR